MSTPRGPGISIGVRDLLLFGKGEVALGVVPPDGSGCLIVCYGRLLCRVERPKPSPGACIRVRVVFRFVSGSVEGLGLMPIHDGRQQTVHSRPFKTIQDQTYQRWDHGFRLPICPMGAGAPPYTSYFCPWFRHSPPAHRVFHRPRQQSSRLGCGTAPHWTPGRSSSGRHSRKLRRPFARRHWACACEAYCDRGGAPA